MSDWVRGGGVIAAQPYSEHGLVNSVAIDAVCKSVTLNRERLLWVEKRRSRFWKAVVGAYQNPTLVVRSSRDYYRLGD